MSVCLSVCFSCFPLLSSPLLSRVPVAARQLHHFGVATEVYEFQVVSHLVRLVAAVFIVLQTELAPLVVA